MSYSAAERGDPSGAWQLAHAAVAHAGPDVRARSWMAARAAEEAARLGESRAALAELDLALSLGSELQPPKPDENALPWTRFFYNSVLAAMAANVYSRLRNARAASTAADWALRTLAPGDTKSRAFVLADVACAAARAGQIERAIESAFDCLDLSERLEVTIARRQLHSLIMLLPTAPGSDAVQELLQALAPRRLQ